MRILKAVQVVVLCGVLSACGGSADGTTSPASYAVTVSPSTLAIALAPGATASANAIVTRQLGASSLIDNAATVTWTTSDATIATVTPSGATATITGLGHGVATITASSNGSTGSTTVTVTAPTCSPLTASNPTAPIGSTTGALAPSDCRDDRASNSGRPADFYRLVVASNQLLTIDISASGFTPDFRLISPTAATLEVVAGATGRIQRAVPAGTYTIAVGTTSAAGGSYTLNVASTAVTTCLLSNNTISAVPATINGTLTVTDCRLSGDLAAAKLYKFTLATAQTVTAVLASTAFPPRMFLNDVGGRFVVSGSSDSLGINQSRFASPLAAGDYYVIVSGTSANPLGAFVLTLSVSQAGALSRIFVSPDSVTLEVGRTRSFLATGSDANFNVVAFTPVWSVAAGGGTISSTGVFTAGTAPGVFGNTVKATGGSISGTATVTVIPTVSACSVTNFAATITPSATVTTQTGSLAATDCKAPDGSFYTKLYRLTTVSTVKVQIDLASTKIDSYLYLFDSALALLDSNDDAAVGTVDSQITRTLSAGTYYIGVSAYRNGSTGAFTLSVKTVP